MRGVQRSVFVASVTRNGTNVVLTVVVVRTVQNYYFSYICDIYERSNKLNKKLVVARAHSSLEHKIRNGRFGVVSGPRTTEPQ